MDPTNEHEFDAVRGGLYNARDVLLPIAAALQQADAVFSVMANAQKHQRVLKASVETLEAKLVDLHGRVHAAETEVQEAQERAAAAVSAANADIRRAQDDAKEAIRRLAEDYEARAAAAETGHAARLRELEQEREAVVAGAHELLQSIEAKVADKNDELQAMEAKLVQLQDARRRFMASLSEG